MGGIFQGISWGMIRARLARRIPLFVDGAFWREYLLVTASYHSATLPGSRPPMSSTSVGLSNTDNWQSLFEAALLEIDLSILSERIRSARDAIHTQLK